jgi:poly[(R)-3-hydroxyalkanoate] polymerase subunit PhaC
MATRRSGGETTKRGADVAEVVGGGEDVSGMSLNGLVNAASSAIRAQTLARESARLYAEWLKIVLGKSTREIPPKDWRFADAAWKDNPLYKRLAQGYLAFCDAIDNVVADNADWKKRERAKFLGGILTSAMSPTNTLLGNPAALKKAYESGGMSLLRGTRNLVADVVARKGLPSQVKASDFKVGENLAVTPGAVVFRNDMAEVIQYAPTTAKVRAIPTLIIVPPIGKYYFMDLAKGRSFTEHAVSRGIQTFITSWRNPQKENGGWGLDDYVQSLLDCVGAVCEVSGSRRVNVLALCAGGILATMMLNTMAATGDTRVNVAAFGVMLLDFDSEAPIGALQARPVLRMAARRSAKKGILPASSLATVFAWMRPNDLVWNYWVNNYLEGKDPPSFDILAWSVDGTNLPGVLHGQFLDIFENNPLPRAGALTVLGKPLDLKRIKVETLVTGGLTDHLTPWKACYRTTQLLGGKSTFVLSNAGHIAALVNPPGNPKATYWLGPKPGPDPERWLAQAHKHTGTWWEVWADWTLGRSGAEKRSRAKLGSKRLPVLDKAPGQYVHQPA